MKRWLMIFAVLALVASRFGQAAEPPAEKPPQPPAHVDELSERVRQSDRVLLVERDGTGALRVVEAIKGPAGCGVDAFLAGVKATFADCPAAEKSWLLFLRDDSDGRAVPELAPLRGTDWFVPSTDRLIERVKAVLALPRNAWAGGYAPHSNPPTLVKAAWARKSAFDQGQDIVVEVALRNSGKTAITIPQFRYNIYDYYPLIKFDVTRPDGRRVILAKPEGPIREADSPSQRTLQPEDIYVHAFRLNRWPLASLPGYEQELAPGEDVFGQPGNYVFHASYDRVRVSSAVSFRVTGAQAAEPEQRTAAKDGDVLVIHGRQYAVQCLGSSDLPSCGTAREGAAWFLWHKGEGWLIDPLKPTLRATFKCQWPVQAVSPDLSLAVVNPLEQPRRPSDPRVTALVALREGRVIGHLPSEVREWGFSADGRFVWPLHGMSTADWSYFDVRQKKAIARPLLDVKPDQWQYWSGAMLSGGKTAVMCARFGLNEEHSQHRVVRFNPDKPDEAEPIKGMDDATSIVGRFGDQILCRTASGASRLVSTETWEGRAISADEARLLGGRRDPTGSLVYLGNSHSGLTIRDTKTGKDTRFYFRDGWSFNARTLGVTFSADGKVAVVATPYDSQLSFIDNGSRKVFRRIGVPVPPAGAFLIEPEHQGKPGTCLVIGTSLPYER